GGLPIPTVEANANVYGTFGLDDKTINFIESLPKEMREQIIELLKQALPLINGSVDRVLDRVNDILNNQINNIECGTIAAGEKLGDDLKKAVSLGLLGSKKQVATLEDDKKRIVEGFSFTDDPGTYAVRYSDFLYDA